MSEKYAQSKTCKPITIKDKPQGSYAAMPLRRAWIFNY